MPEIISPPKIGDRVRLDITAPADELLKTLPLEVGLCRCTEPTRDWTAVFLAYCHIMSFCDLEAFKSMLNLVDFGFFQKRDEKYPYENDIFHTHIIDDWFFTNTNATTRDLINRTAILVKTFDAIKKTSWSTVISLYVEYYQ